MTKKVTIEIFKDGSIKAETNGIKGKKCEEYKKIIENLLEAKTINCEHTSEYYEEDNELEIENIKHVKNNL